VTPEGRRVVEFGDTRYEFIDGHWWPDVTPQERALVEELERQQAGMRQLLADRDRLRAERHYLIAESNRLRALLHTFREYATEPTTTHEALVKLIKEMGR